MRSSKATEGWQLQPQPPPPVKIVVLGATGSGKTSLVKATDCGCGCIGRSELRVLQVASTAPLNVGNTVESESKVTNVINTEKFLILDPPGIGDTHGNDEGNMVELTKTIRDLESLHLVLLVFNGQQVRLDAPLVQMLRLFENVFSPAFWANAALVFTRWFRDEIGEFPGDEVGKKREWNDKLQAEFPFLSEYRKAAPIPCFFVNSVVIHDDRYRASERMKAVVMQNESTMTDIRLLAQALPPLRTGSMHPHPLPAQQTALTSVSPSQLFTPLPPATPGESMHDVGQFLHELGLAEYIPRVLEQKLYTRDVLDELSGTELASLGFSREEISKIRHGVQSHAVIGIHPESDLPDTPEQLASELGSFGVPTEPFATCTVHTALSLSEDLMLERLPLLGERTAFRRWKRERLAGQKVSDEYLWLGAPVERGRDWEYEPDSDDDDSLPQDGEPGAHGIVVGWHPREGDRVGDDAPLQRGWVRVRWLVTGFCHNYRAGADNKFDLRFASGTLQGESLDGVKKLEIKHLRCTFGYPTGVKYPHFSMFDVRPEACRLAGGFEHGDVVVADGRQDKTRAVCIGVKPSGPKRILLWFQLKDKHARGAGLFDDFGSGKYKKVGHEHVQAAKREDFTCGSDAEIENDDRDYVMKNLEPNFGYDARKGFSRFDTRDEILARFKLGMRHGDLLLDKEDNKKLHCIGVALLGNGSPYPRVWLHMEGDVGAAVAPNLYKALNRFAVLRNEVLREATEEQSSGLSEEDLRQISADMQLTFEFPRGIGRHPPLCRFDIRPNIVSRITGGLLPGQVFQYRGDKLVVIGASPHPHNDQPLVWFFREGDNGAGLLDMDYSRMRRVLRNTGETKDLSELRKQVEAQARLELGGGDIDSQSVEDVQRQLHRLLAHAIEVRRSGRT